MALAPKDASAALLEEIVFSVDDTSSALRKRSSLLTEEFMSYVQRRAEETQDEDEREAYQAIVQEIATFVEDKAKEERRESFEYEKELNEILKRQGTYRRQYMEENKEKLTDDFCTYLLEQSKEYEDLNSKTIFASILQMLGEVKNVNLLSSDSSLAELSNVDLDKEDKPLLLENKPDPNEMLLAEFVFSKADLLEIILTNMHRINDQFLEFLETKVDNSKDPDERIALSSLRETIERARARIQELEAEQEGMVAAPMSMASMKSRMKDIQLGEQMDPKKAEKEIKIEGDSLSTFNKLLNKLTQRPEGVTLTDAINMYYDKCDYTFMEQLGTQIQSSNGERQQELIEVQSTLNEVMRSKVEQATEKLQKILSQPSPQMIDATVRLMARNGEIDDGLYLLTQANVQQAQEAGATAAVQVLSRILQLIITEKERSISPDKKLLRALIRTDSVELRQQLIYEAFKPRKHVNLNDGTMEETGYPDVAPPAFIDTVREFISSFGNLEELQLMERCQQIIGEAEAIAKEFFGESMSPRERQDYMFNKGSVSVFDLEQLEDTAASSGEAMPWQNNKYDSMNPEDVIIQKSRRIGGSSIE